MPRNPIPGPYVMRYPSPQDGQTNVPVKNGIRFNIRSDGPGININTIKVRITDSHGVNTYDFTSPYFKYTGIPASYEVEVRPPQPWAYEENVQAEIWGGGTNLVGDWRFEGNANDMSGNGNHGTVYGATLSADGKFGRAYSYDGVNDYISFGSSNLWAFGISDFSYTLWVKYTGNRVNGETLLGSFVNPLNIPEGYPWEIVTRRESATQVEVYLNSGGPDITYDLPSAFLLNTWYHFAVTRSGTTLKLFIDGIEKASVTNSDSVPLGTLVAGGAGVSGGLQYYHPGLIDEVRIYNKALTAGEIGQEMLGFLPGIVYEYVP